MTLRWPLAFALSCAACAPAIASAQQLRFAGTAPGGVVGTGNTLGLSKQTDLNGPGTRDSIGTFISLGNGVDNVPLNAGNPWPMGTTNDWMQNGSAAVLSLPSEATVLYAELLWGGSYLYDTEDVSASLDLPVTLSMGNAQIAVSPDPLTSLTIDEIAVSAFTVKYYLRSANVTPFVQASGPGAYSVLGVPATQIETINSLNAAGWTLVVAYRDEGSPTRNLSVFVGGSFVDEDSQQDYVVSGFCSPPAGDVNGTAVMSTIEGDANLTGDQLLIAPTAAGPFVQLSGPNNPADNFFCSQLNDPSGLLDTQGTFGAANHDPATGTNVSGGRQGWDVTTVSLSSQAGQLQNGQTSATLRTITTGDSYVPILAAFALDVNAPYFGGGATSMKASATNAEIGDTFTVTATLQNLGGVAAEGLFFSSVLPQGLSLVSFSTDGAAGDINGGPVDAALLTAGVIEGDLAAGATRSVTMTLQVDSAPPGSAFFLLSKWAYGFEVCQNAALLDESFSQSLLVTYDAPVETTATTTSTTTTGAGGAGGTTETASGGAGGSSGVETTTGGGDTVAEDPGCSCRTPGNPSEHNAAALLALGGLGLVAARRRASRRGAL